MTDEKNKTVIEIVSTIGRANLHKQGSIPQQSISRAITENLMPSGWYPVVRDMCAEKDIVCPDSLFRFIGPRKAQS